MVFGKEAELPGRWRGLNFFKKLKNYKFWAKSSFFDNCNGFATQVKNLEVWICKVSGDVEPEASKFIKNLVEN